MPSTRRRFAFFGVALLAGIGGCSGVTKTTPLQEIQLDLLNQAAAPLTFHFVLEADDGLGQWQEFALDPGADRQLDFQPASEREWSGYHAIAGEKQVSGSLLGQGDERVCLQLTFRIQEDQIVATLPTDQALCNDE